MEGTVKFFNRSKGFGFVSGDDGVDYFVHFSAVERGTFLRDNDKVSFEPGEGERGAKAENVHLIQKGSEREDSGEAAPVEESNEEAPAEESTEEEPAQEEEEVPAEESTEEEPKQEE